MEVAVTLLLMKKSCDMNVSSTSTVAAVVMVGLNCSQEHHLLVHMVPAASVPVCLGPFSHTELIDIYQSVEFIHF